MAEINFPRGGKQPATLGIKKREFNQIFAKNPKNGRKRHNRRVDAPEETPNFLDGLLTPHKEFRNESARKLSFETLREGMLVLGAVMDIQDYRLTISLPGRIRCQVPITNISAPYTKILKLVAEGEKLDFHPLKHMFHVGQHIVARVGAVVPSSNTVELSLCPRELHRGWLHTDVTENSVVMAAVASDEEKVYTMDVGIDEVRAVLPKSAAGSYEVACNGSRPLGVGQVVRCGVACHSCDAGVTTLQLSADPDQVLAHVGDPRHMSLNTAMPGTRFQVRIIKSLTDGWKVRVGSKWPAVVYQDHVRPGLELTVGSSHEARLLYVLEPFKMMYMSLLPGLCSPEPPVNPFLGFKLGAKLRKAKVEAVSGVGVLMSLRSGKRGIVTCMRALGDSTPVDPSLSVTARLQQLYPPGSTQPCCILDYNYMDQLYICTTESEVMKAKYLFPSDLTPGQRVTCQIIRMVGSGALVTLDGDGFSSTRSLRGLVPNLFLADVPLTQPHKKFQPDSRWTARVMSTADGLYLTTKPSLLSSTLPPLARFEDARVGDPQDGTVVMVSPRGLLVLFYADVRGFLPLKGLHAGHDPERDYHLGKTVHVYVSSVLPEKKMMSLTLFPPPEEELPGNPKVSSESSPAGHHKPNPDRKQSPGGQKKLKRGPEQPLNGLKDSKPTPEQSVKGHKKLKLAPEQPLNGLQDSKPTPEKSIKGHKKLKLATEQPPKGPKDSNPTPEKSVKGHKKSKPDPENPLLGQKKSKSVPEHPVKSPKKRKLAPDERKRTSKVSPEPRVFTEPLLIKEEMLSDDDRPESQSSSVEFVPAGMLSADHVFSPEWQESPQTEIKTEPDDDTTTDQARRTRTNSSDGIPECVEIMSELEDDGEVPRKKVKRRKKSKNKSQLHLKGDVKPLEESKGMTSGTESSTTQLSKKKKKKRKGSVNGLDDSATPVKKMKKSKKREEAKMNGEHPAKLDPEEKPWLSLSAGFVWDANPERLSALTASTNRGDSSDDELPEAAPKRQTAAERREAARAEEQRLRALEMTSAEVPHTADDFDRLVMSMPNCSLHWTRYMALHLASTEVDKARAVGRRALQTISFREDQERLNVWLAMLNLENLYGSSESLEEVLKEAVQMNEPVKVYIEVLDMFAVTGKCQDATKLIATVMKKYRDDPGLWVGACRALLKLGEVEKARALLPRALKGIHMKQHVELITKFAQLEQQWGDPVRGQTLLEQVLTSYPRRVDVWNVYVDMLVKHGSLDLARQVLDRAVCQKLGVHKLKALYKKYLAFEEKHGTPQDVTKVRQMAFDYVESLIRNPGSRT